MVPLLDWAEWEGGFIRIVFLRMMRRMGGLVGRGGGVERGRAGGGEWGGGAGFVVGGFDWNHLCRGVVIFSHIFWAGFSLCFSRIAICLLGTKRAVMQRSHNTIEMNEHNQRRLYCLPFLRRVSRSCLPRQFFLKWMYTFSCLDFYIVPVQSYWSFISTCLTER